MKTPTVSLHAVATAYPPYCFRQDEVMAKSAEVFGHRAELMQRMAKSYGNAGVKQRNSCVPLEWYATSHCWPERAQLFEENAVKLLTEAGGKVLKDAGVNPADVAATVVVSSTGFVTPSLDSLLQGPLGLSPTVQRLPVFGLGCAGGVIGLSRAAAMARALPGQWVLFLCVELCGLTFRPVDDSKANIIGTTIFGDGAAAVLVRTDGEPALAQIGIPMLVREKMRGVTDAFLTKHGLAQTDLAGLIVHPGGEKVLEALEACYGLEKDELADSRGVLAEHGNMSAVTVLAVLQRALARGAKGRHLMTALGPGFSVGMCLLDL